MSMNAQMVMLDEVNGYSWPTYASEMSRNPLLYQYLNANGNPPPLGRGMYEIPFGAVVDSFKRRATRESGLAST